MAISTTLRNAIVEEIDTQIATGSGTALFQLVDAAGTTVYLQYSYDADPLAAAAGGQAASSFVATTVVGLVTGTATHYKILNRDGTELDFRPLSASVEVVLGEDYTANSVLINQPAS